MKALVLEAYGTPHVLTDIPKPVPAGGEVLVRVRASGINPLDIKIKAGQAAHARNQLPSIQGLDLSGVVEAVGEGVSSFKPGDEVYGMTGGIAGIPGSLAEYASVDANLLAIKPATLGFREAAALPLSVITAWEGLVDRANVREGMSVLVHGGAGGVGHVAVQLARAKGATVYATVSSRHFGLMESYGAVPIDYALTPPDAYTSLYTGGLGFDVVYDTLGGATLDASFTVVKRYTGHVVSILGWGSHSLAPLSFRGATYSGVFTLYPLISGEGRGHHGVILREAAGLIEAGAIRPLMDGKAYTLDTVADAYTAIENRRADGRVVVEIG